MLGSADPSQDHEEPGNEPGRVFKAQRDRLKEAIRVVTLASKEVKAVTKSIGDEGVLAEETIGPMQDACRQPAPPPSRSSRPPTSSSTQPQ
jgi:hypothetical protein